jgi:hypothetical protein
MTAVGENKDPVYIKTGFLFVVNITVFLSVISKDKVMNKIIHFFQSLTSKKAHPPAGVRPLYPGLIVMSSSRKGKVTSWSN